MRRVTILVKKFAILCHRWMGVAFSLLFSWWFVSGIFIMYWTYPEVTEAQRLERAPVLEASRIHFTPEEAYAVLESDTPYRSVRLASFDGHPAYFFRFGRGASGIVLADTGEEQVVFSDDLLRRSATDWAGLPIERTTEEIFTEPDQWTLSGSFRNLRPLHKFSFDDGQQVYVSENTGQVEQYTTLSDRIFAHLGAIPHWLYYTPLRVNGELWSRVVIWSSGIATIAATLGLMVGIWMWSPRKKYRYQGAPTGIPYTGEKRLHTILGLFFGFLACTWAFSGMLSMDPFPIPSGGLSGARGQARPGAEIIPALRGDGDLDLIYSKTPAEALAALDPDFGARLLEYGSFDGKPYYVATNAAGNERMIPMEGDPIDAYDSARVEAIVREAAGADLARLDWMDQYDAYYLDRSFAAPLPVIRATMNDPDETIYYVDPASATVVGLYSHTNQAFVNRWLYHGLHSLNFPWLYNHRPAWDFVVLALMGICTWLCWTSLVLTWRVLRRKLGGRTVREDLSVTP